jgi:hypothetical protein
MGWGLSPAPPPPFRHLQHSNIYILQFISYNKHYVWLVGVWSFPKAWTMVGGHGFKTHGPPNNFFEIFHLDSDWVPRGCPCLGHVAPPHLTKFFHMSNPDWIFHPHLPSQLLPHVSATSAS